ncbi:DUF2058 domain-containing protein [Vibrio sp. SS-MA-C1-2]|uniref:DUF2058 domain-containing protein n=1 Tax=Vibrio sp. SS-MA-C1-2 TaxID=2908646 RepID=UPI001F3B0DD4|nr:DUF2058 domain-containing protein [Vibrio sp. SS-MA-C1-2]UJF17120.1 DUF2058 domain-containing protein [Vibrio sp. SS-MA-C1-2]
MAKLTLQEQMLKAGLVDKKKLKKAGKQAKKSRVQAREAKAAAEENRELQLAKDKELNQKRDAEVKQKAIVAQIKQLIEVNKLDRSKGDIGYNFTDQNLVKKIYVDSEQQRLLNNGKLAIVHYLEGYEVVAGGVAEKIAQRDDAVVVVQNEVDNSSVDEDDPYAEFVIPDDLMW